MTTVLFSRTPATRSLGTLASLGITNWPAIVPSKLSDLAAIANACFAMHLLNPLYTGPCLQVKVGSTFTDIGFTANGVIDTAALTTAAGSNTAIVTKWYDQSGSGMHAVPTTAGQEPVIVNSGTMVVDATNGLPVIATRGGSSIKGMMVPLNFSPASGFVAAAAYVMPTGRSGSVAGNLQNSTNYDGIIIGNYSSGKTLTSIRNGGVATNTAAAGNAAGRNADVSYYASGTLSRILNGAAAGSVSATYSAHDTSFAIGESRTGGFTTTTADTNLQALLLTPATLTAADAGLVSADLNALYNLY